MVNIHYDQRRYAITIAAIVGALLFFTIPIINLIRILPTFKEILIGAAVTYAMLETTEYVDGAAFAVVTGMIAAVIYNIIRFVLISFVGLGSSLGGSAGATEGLAGGVGLAALGALVNVIGLIFFSPIGYAIGGALGALLNEQL